jgi:glycerol-3-phosphate acyltransferase PlsX
MGHEYAEWVLQKARPKIGLLSIGEEDTKGNEVTKEAFKILKAGHLNFVGNVEGRDVYSGTADVIVSDGFIGNVALKISEGLADVLGKLLKREIAATLGGKLGYLMLRSAFQRFRRRVDYAEYGGAPLLGVNGICIICHGRSSAKAIKNAIRVARTQAEGRVNQRIQKDIEESMAIYNKAHEEYLESLKRG